MTGNYFHSETDCVEFVEGLGYIRVYRIDGPEMDFIPHFHVNNPWTGKDVAICFKDNRYADPDNNDRLTPEECKILDNWMREMTDYRSVFDPDYNYCNNWRALSDSMHTLNRDWIDKFLDIQPDYTTIKEPLPISKDHWEYKNHYGGNKLTHEDFEIKGVGNIVIYSADDPKMYYRPHAHVITYDGRNVQVCIFENRYADPDANERFNPDECIKFNEWVHGTGDYKHPGWGLMRFEWETDSRQRCIIPRSALDSRNMPDYTSILEPRPIADMFNCRFDPIVVGVCNEIGKIIVFGNEITPYSNIPHFYVQRLDELIPIGILHSVYLDPTSTKLTSMERFHLMNWMLERHHVMKGLCFSNWQYAAMSWAISDCCYLDETDCYYKISKMPNYNIIRTHKIGCKWNKY